VANRLDVKTLEGWLWEAACSIRGDVDAPKYKDYILPLIFFKRLSDVYDDEIENLTKKFGREEVAKSLAKEKKELIRFYIPEEARWESISKDTRNMGERLTIAMRTIAKHNEKLVGVIDYIDFNATQGGQRVISDEKIIKLFNILGRYRLGLKDVEPDIIGRAYEYLLRKFAEGSGASAGEFYTPKEVAILMANILDPKPEEDIYDPCCGSGGLLIKCFLRFKEKYEENPEISPLRFYGQEILHSTYAMAMMNSVIHDMEKTDIALGDTMVRPRFLRSDSSLKLFDVVTANPMWNQKFDQNLYENDTFGRFSFGYPPSNSADWGWIQHMYSSLNDGGRIAVVLDTGAVSRGSGNVGKNRERDIRKGFIEKDLVEAVILMPENLFYNTSAPGIILVVNKNKKREEEVLLINASDMFAKGRPKNYLTGESIEKISGIYLNWEEVEGTSKIVSNQEIADNDYNLSPSRYVSKNNDEEVLPLEDAVVQLRTAEEEREEIDSELRAILKRLGVY